MHYLIPNSAFSILLYCTFYYRRFSVSSSYSSLKFPLHCAPFSLCGFCPLEAYCFHVLPPLRFVKWIFSTGYTPWRLSVLTGLRSELLLKWMEPSEPWSSSDSLRTGIPNRCPTHTLTIIFCTYRHALMWNFIICTLHSILIHFHTRRREKIRSYFQSVESSDTITNILYAN